MAPARPRPPGPRPPGPRPPGLRQRRLALKLTLEQVSADTKIPVQHLKAIEENRLDDLPEGPFRQGFLRKVRERLGLDPETGLAPAGEAPIEPEEDDPVKVAERIGDRPDEDLPFATKPSAVPLWLVRGVAIVASVGLLGLAGWQVSRSQVVQDVAPAVVKAPSAPGVIDQKLEIRAQKNTRFTVKVDDGEPVDKALANGDAVSFDACCRVELDVPSSDALKITWNGRSIVPQGRQDEPRRLVFVDDE